MVIDFTTHKERLVVDNNTQQIKSVEGDKEAMKILLTVLLLQGLVLPPMQSDKEKWLNLSANVDLVLIVAVKHVGPTPGFWSGYLAATQRVRFKVVRVLKGNLNAGEVEVEYYLVKNDHLVDNELPRLSPEIFEKGNQLVLFLKADQKRKTSSFAAEQNRGTAPADADTLRALSP